jgi:hypothetical protein
LKLVWICPRCVPHGREAFRQEDEERDDDTDRRLRRADSTHGVLDGGRLDLGQPDDGDECDEECPEADERAAIARERRVPLGRPRLTVHRKEEVAVAHGLDEHEDRIQGDGGDPGERELGG